MTVQKEGEMKALANKRTGSKGGYTIIELVLIMAVIGLLSMIAIPNLIHIRDKADLAAAKATVRDLQTVTFSFFEENMTSPSTAQLNSLWISNGNDSILAQYEIFSPYSSSSKSGGTQTHLFPDGVYGYKPLHYIICTTFEIHGAAYVYSLDDRSPRTAAIGTHPLSPLNCGADGGSLSPAGGSDDDDDDVGGGDDEVAAGDDDDDDDDDNDAGGDDDTSADDDDAADDDDDSAGDDDDTGDDDDDSSGGGRCCC